MTKSMKAGIISIVICLVGLSVQAGGKPDLVVTLSLVTEKYTDTNAGNITCYNVTPRYTITNQGQSPAAGFRIRLDCKPGPGVDWQVWAFYPNRKLNPGESWTNGPKPTERTKWCEGYGLKSVGFRITADDEDVVKEGPGENNNTATKLFPAIFPQIQKRQVQQQAK